MSNKIIPTFDNTHMSSTGDLFLSQLKPWFVMNQSKLPLEKRKQFLGWQYYDDNQEIKICVYKYNWETNEWSEYEGETNFDY